MRAMFAAVLGLLGAMHFHESPSQIVDPFTPFASGGPAVVFYLSLSTDTTLTGLGPGGSDLVVEEADILSWNGTNYDIFFDASAAGLGTTAEILAFDIQPTRILMGFQHNLTIPDVGTFTGGDIVAWDRSTGVFSLFFDGSLVELADTTSEIIDAIQVLPNGTLVFGTGGNPVVTGGAGLQDEDLITFTPTTEGDYTAGTYAFYVDGSDLGFTLSTEAINSPAVSGPDIYFVAAGAFTALSGLTGIGNDVVLCANAVTGPITSCGTLSLYFVGNAHGLTGLTIDGLDWP